MTWPTAPIGDVAQVNPRRDSRLWSLDDNVQVTFVPMASVDEVTGTIAAPEVKPFADVRRGFTPFVEGDVIFAKITPCMQNGKSAVARDLSNGLGFGSTEFHVLRPGPRVLSEWLWYFVRQRSFREEACRQFRGSAGQQRVPAAFVEQHEIPLPSIEEQRRTIGRIVECLERVDEIRRLGHEAASESEALLPALLGALCEDSWPSAPVGDLATEIRNGWSGRTATDGRPAHVLRLSCVHGLTIDPEDTREQLVSPDVMDTFGLRAGDVFLVRGNGTKRLVGRAAIAESNESSVIFNDLLIRVRFDDRMLPEFANVMFHTPPVRRQIESLAKTAAGIWKINQRMVKKLRVPCPPVGEQEEVVRQFAHIRKVVTEISTATVWTDPEVLMQAVLRKAFAGEL